MLTYGVDELTEGASRSLTCLSMPVGSKSPTELLSARCWAAVMTSVTPTLEHWHSNTPCMYMTDMHLISISSSSVVEPALTFWQKSPPITLVNNTWQKCKNYLQSWAYADTYCYEEQTAEAVPEVYCTRVCPSALVGLYIYWKCFLQRSTVIMTKRSHEHAHRQYSLYLQSPIPLLTSLHLE